MRVKVLLLVLLLVAVSRTLASGLPDLGDPASAALSPRLEHRIGEQAAREIRSDPSYVDDPEII
ncbi:MAG TPA: hypothetical protein VNE59_11360, partial [Burkholderiales bacterium]|nr:hypothetical protein [Burkholderiales bacterium]